MRQVKNRDVTMMRDAIQIMAGEPGAGGASTYYELYLVEDDLHTKRTVPITFQTGNPAEELTGFTNEALLSIVLDRLEGFQSGPFSSRETACAKTHIEEALHWMHSRSLERADRGVLGKLEK
jgi:hypothetical protein